MVKRDLENGRQFGRWLVVKRVENQGKHHRYLCQCSCGVKREVIKFSLTSGASISCGCYSQEATTQRFTKHGMARTIEYRTWQSMKNRCTNPHDSNYPNYGGRGISFAPEWADFNAFLASVGEKPSPQYSLDRIDPNGNYEPQNIRWSSSKTQANNRRTNVSFTFADETKTMKEWATHFGVDYNTFKGRIKRGWSFEKAANIA